MEGFLKSRNPAHLLWIQAVCVVPISGSVPRTKTSKPLSMDQTNTRFFC